MVVRKRHKGKRLDRWKKQGCERRLRTTKARPIGGRGVTSSSRSTRIAHGCIHRVHSSVKFALVVEPVVLAESKREKCEKQEEKGEEEESERVNASLGL